MAIRTCAQCAMDFDRRRSERMCADCREQFQWCSGCQTGKPKDTFYSNQRVCVDCSKQSVAGWKQENKDRWNETQRSYHQRNPHKRREYKLRRAYGLEPGAYEAMYAEQDGKCAICGLVPDDTLHVDHDHSTGEVRSLLCGRCNPALGLFKDDPDLLIAAAMYVINHQSKAAETASHIERM